MYSALAYLPLPEGKPGLIGKPDQKRSKRLIAGSASGLYKAARRMRAASARSARDFKEKERIYQYQRGAFLILAKGRGYFFGVGETLSMTTRRWVISVPGMG